MTVSQRAPDAPTSVPPFVQRVADQFPPREWLQHTVVVAVSGGADSVALLRALCQLNLESTRGSGKLVVAHVEHGLRGSDSLHDQRFVEALAQTLDLEFRSIPLDGAELRQVSGVGLEAAARSARYRALRDCAHQVGARFLVTGHTWDDQVETVLFRLLRGTGISGLSGIRPLRPIDAGLTLVRPLLAIRRADVEAYLEHLGQPACTDATNRDRTFSRNWIRHDLLPMLRSRFPGVDDAVANLADVAADFRRWAVQTAAGVRGHLELRPIPGGVELKATELRDQPSPVIQLLLLEIWEQAGWPLRDMGNEHWRRLTELIRRSPSEGSLSLPGRVDARLFGNDLRLTCQKP